VSELDTLYELQVLDSTLDQLDYRRSHLAEREALAAARRSLAAARDSLEANRTRQSELDAAYEASERSAQELDAKRKRLEAQLRTIVVTRQAEALQREIATVRAEHEHLDDRGLELIEESEALQAGVAALEHEMAEQERAVREATAAYTAVVAELDEEIARVKTERGEQAARVDPTLLATYEQMRPRFQGVAVAKLNGARCSGCHLDLSRVELEAVWAAAPGTVVECPQCARMLVK
jgi:predicted  nucleic acid-binding Zn-ribbon protein